MLQTADCQVIDAKEGTKNLSEGSITLVAEVGELELTCKELKVKSSTCLHTEF